MFTLACPQSRVRPQGSRHCNLSSTFSYLIVLLAVAFATTACSTMNAGSTSAAPMSQPITISADLPSATVGTSYNAVIAVSGGSAPYSFATRIGHLPPGLNLNPSTGSISGTPRTQGSYRFAISVTDKSEGAQGLRTFQLVVKHPSTPQSVSVEISPASVTIPSGSAHQFAALVSNANTPAVTWSATAGSVTSSGVFTAPKVSTSTVIQLTATSNADPTKSATATVNVEASASTTLTSLALTTGSLPEATVGTHYTASLQATGGKTPYHWKVLSGTLPSGMALSSDQGTIDGITSQSGPFTFSAAVTDASGQTVSRKLSLTAALPSTGNFDGPAELPRVYVNSALADTPAPGVVHLVKAGGNFQAALDTAKCGDIIQLQAAATFTGQFVFPAKSCDDAHWIIVRTSSSNSALPAEGKRLTPCYAGVASLPARPAYPCASPKNVLAKLVFDGVGSGPVIFAKGANHYRLLGLEITRNRPRALVYNLAIHEKDGTADHLVFDRLWFHGTAQDETTRGIMLSGITNAAVVDSYFSDFHCVSISGGCGDSQAIGGGTGNTAMGPYKIENNYLEAAGENILFGGGAATRTPEDIVIRRNHFFKPLIWKRGTAGYVGGRDGHPFIVKNHLEFKNAARVLIEGNVMENSWGGFSQFGFSILLTPKNQGGLCPLCVLHDVTIRYGTIANVGNGITVGNGKADCGALSLGGWNESIHDLVITHVNGSTYGGGGHAFQQSNANDVTPLRNVAIHNVTAISDESKAAIILVGNLLNHRLAGFSWTNNILSAAGIGIDTTGGGDTNCAYSGFGGGVVGRLDRCFTEYNFAGNVLIGATGQWPDNNQPTSTVKSVMFSSTNYSLLTSLRLSLASPFRNTGTDGRDPGADVAAVSAAIAGVAP